MLKNARVAAMIPTQNLEQAAAWYRDKLGLEPDPTMSDPGGSLYRGAEGTGFMLYMSGGKSDASFTQLAFEVDDVVKVAGELTAKGVKLIDYDLPTLKTENGVAQTPAGAGAWFKDPDGNLLSIFQQAAVPAAKS